MERKSSAYLNSDDMFSTYAQKTYMENIPCELALHIDELAQRTAYVLRNLAFVDIRWNTLKFVMALSDYNF